MAKTPIQSQPNMAATLVKIKPLEDRATLVTEIKFESKQAMEEHVAKEAAEKQRGRELVDQVRQRLVAENGGERKISMADAAKKYDWQDPGPEEVHASCNTLEAGWQDARLEDVFVILDDSQGAPTQVLGADVLRTCRQQAKVRPLVGCVLRRLRSRPPWNAIR